MTTPDAMISPTVWQQPIKADRKELHLWHIPRSVVRTLGLEDNTSLRLRIQFSDGRVLPQSEFAITSGVEIAFDKVSQAFVEPYIDKQRPSYFTVQLIEQFVAVEDAAATRQGFLRWHEALQQAAIPGRGESWWFSSGGAWFERRLGVDARLGREPDMKYAEVEINLPKTLGDANCASVLARDAAGRRWLLRQGHLHQQKNRCGYIKQNQFDQVTTLEPVDLKISKPRGRTWYRVAMLDGSDAEIQEQTRHFIEHCTLVRAYFGSARQDDLRIASALAGSPELPGQYVVAARDAMTVRKVQARVWQDLKAVMDRHKVHCGKPLPCDGYDVDMVIEGPTPILLEIKTSTAAADVYTGLGQLMVYARIFPGLAKHKQVLLLPEGQLKAALLAAVRKCGIVVATYSGSYETGFRFAKDFLTLCGCGKVRERRKEGRG